jgi:hypothetical protein
MRRRRYEILLPVRHNDGRLEFFARYKATLRERFEQIEIHIASYLVDIV